MSTPSSTRDALVVGICNYEYLNDDENGSTDLNKIKKINTLAEQARKLADLLETQGGFKVTRLPSTDLNEKVDLPVLEQAIEKLLFPPKESPTQTALLFFAGHGLVKETKLGKEGFLATSEVDGKTVYGFSLKDLRELLQRSSVKQLIVFLESCYSGELLTDFEEVFKDDSHDICFVTSARAHEPALAEGLLVEALLETLDCQRRLEDFITSEMLTRYLDKIQAINPGWQRFVYRTGEEPILLSSVNKTLFEEVIQKNQSVIPGNQVAITQLEMNSFELGYLMLVLCTHPEDEDLLILRIQNIISQIVGIDISVNEVTCDNLPLVIREKVFPKLATENIKALHWLMLSNNFFVCMAKADAGVRNFMDLNELTENLPMDNNLKKEVSRKLVLASDPNISNHDSVNYLLDGMNIIRKNIIRDFINGRF